MILMSIDASTKSTGVAIFDKNKNLIHYECIASASSDTYNRIKIMWKRIYELFCEYNITDIIMEDVLPEDVKHNQNTFNALHYLQAYIVLNFHDYKQKVELITANQWRKAIGITIGRYGTRGSVKMQAQNLVKEKFNINANDDICDAICIGLSKLYGAAVQTKNLKSSPIGSERSAF